MRVLKGTITNYCSIEEFKEMKELIDVSDVCGETIHCLVNGR